MPRRRPNRSQKSSGVHNIPELREFFEQPSPPAQHDPPHVHQIQHCCGHTEAYQVEYPSTANPELWAGQSCWACQSLQASPSRPQNTSTNIKRKRIKHGNDSPSEQR